jgi:hypothetical protein
MEAKKGEFLNPRENEVEKKSFRKSNKMMLRVIITRYDPSRSNFSENPFGYSTKSFYSR